MNRRQKIIVSITGIFIVLLALVGLTYAYFLTRITGNENEKSISVTTANLELLYEDGNGLLSATNIEPGDYITFKGKNANGEEFETQEKTFSVENKGNVTISYGIYLEEVINEFKRYDDLVLTITCTSTKTGNTCEGFSGTFPRIDALVTTNKVELGEKHNYTLKLQYKEMNIDQSVDMNKRLSAKVQLYGLNNTFENENSLAYKIISNAKSGNGSTTYRNVSLSLPAQEVTSVFEQTVGSAKTKTLTDSSYYTYAAEVEFNELSGYSLINPQVDTWANIKSNPSKLASFKYLRRESGVASLPEERTQTIKDMVRVDNISDNLMTYTMLELQQTEQNVESTLSATLDDYGVSFYYRGNVEDNYVNYNGMCWRIVRILGDGSTKLILEDSASECSSTMTRNFSIGDENYYYGADYDTATKTYIANYLNPTYQSEKSMRNVFKNWFEEKNFDETDLRKGDWCIGNVTDAYKYSEPYNKLTESVSSLIQNKIAFLYESYARLYRQYPEKATLKCGNGLKVEDDYVGTLTTDEITFAGDRIGFYSKNNYLEAATIVTGDWKGLSLQMKSNSSQVNRDNVVAYQIVNNAARLTSYTVDKAEKIRPSIVLANTISYDSGNGTVDNPYIVK